MKSQLFRLPLSFLLGLSLVCGLFAEDAAEEPAGPAEPPYKAGDLLQEGGHEIELEDGMAMNFRMVEDQIRLYFLDEEKKVIEPPYASGSVRFADVDRARKFYPIQRLSEDLGLGSLVRVPPPHRSFTVLTLDTDAPKRFSFRYLPSMNPAPLDEEAPDEPNAMY